MGFRWVNSLAYMLERRLQIFLLPASMPLKGTSHSLASRDRVYFPPTGSGLDAVPCFGQWDISIRSPRRDFKRICASEPAISCFSGKRPTSVWISPGQRSTRPSDPCCHSLHHPAPRSRSTAHGEPTAGVWPNPTETNRRTAWAQPKPPAHRLWAE